MSALSRCAAAAGLLLAGLAWPAGAQVMEIGAGGAVRIRSGAGAVAWTSADAPKPEEQGVEVPPEAVTPAARLDAPASYQAQIEAIAERSGLSPHLLAALVWQESRWKVDARSPKGALGLAQLLPSTARSLGVDPRDPNANLWGGARYLRAQLDRFDGDVEKALAAYNAGPRRVVRAGGIPAIRETRAYVAAILARVGQDRPQKHGDRP